jgi:hypothetical protein
MRWLLICSPGDGCGQLHQFHQQGQAGAVALIVLLAGVLAGAVLDDMASSISSTSGAGSALSPWA